MKKIFLKKWLKVFSLSLIFGGGIYGYGCADGWWGIGNLTNFSPEAFADKSYQPMFYEPYDRFYNYGYIDNLSFHDSEIVKDWKTFLGNNTSEEAIKYYLLDKDANQDVSRLYEGLEKSQHTSVKYPMALSNEKVQLFVRFLYLAKTVEAYSTQTYDYWDYENRVTTKAGLDVVKEAENIYDKWKGKNEFIKNRLWFQVAKAKFYSDNQKSIIDFFEETSKEQPRNMLYYRALSYVAGAYYNQSDFINSNMRFAEVFNEIPSLRQISLYNFRPMDDSSIQSLLKQTKDRSVQAAALAINGYYRNEVDAMREIYKVDSKSPHINFLLTRWVNKQEEQISLRDQDAYFSEEKNNRIKNSKSYFAEIKKKIDQPTLKWIEEVAAKPEKLDNPALWSLASGYLNIFQGNYDKAKKAFQTAKSQEKKNELMQNQIRLFELINEVSQLKKVDLAAERKLLADMKWLMEEVPEKYNWESPFRHDYARNWIKEYLSAVYEQNGDMLMAEIVYTGGDFYLKEQNSKEMEAFFKKSNKSDWEKLFASLYRYNLSDIYESRAVYLFYENKIDDAIAAMDQANPNTTINYYGEKFTAYYKDAELLGNPFNGKIKDCNDCDHQAKQSVKYTSLTFLKKVKEMQDKLAQQEDVYNNALLLGNAFYNASYYGNARSFYYNNIVGEYGSNYINDRNKPYLHNMEWAKKYYQIAASAAETKEQQAKMAYMLSKVERNEFYSVTYFSQNYFYPYGNDIVNFKAWQGFKDLKQKYSDTQYYKEVIAECGYFRKYLGLQ